MSEDIDNDENVVRLVSSHDEGEESGQSQEYFVFDEEEDFLHFLAELSSIIDLKSVTGFSAVITHKQEGELGEHDVSFLNNFNEKNILTLIGGLDILKSKMVSNLM